MTRIIFVTQVLDAADPVLGASADLVRALGIKCDGLAVVANEVRAVPSDLDAEVISLGKETGAGRALRWLRYQRAVTRLSRRMRADALLAHMCPVYLNLVAPIAKSLGVRTILWYAHPARTPGLRLAERLADVVLTSLPGAYPGATRKVVAIGQAIDMQAFPYAEPRVSDGPLRLLALGRTSPSKGYPVAIRGIARACERGVDVRLRIVGPSTTAAERRHRDELRRLIDGLGLKQTITLESEVPRGETRGLLQWCDAVVNTTIPGSGDKAVFEAMATGRPVVVSNPAFASVVSDLPLSLTFSNGNAEELADRIVELTLSKPGHRAELGWELRNRVEQGHSVDHWADGVLGLLNKQRDETLATPFGGRAKIGMDPARRDAQTRDGERGLDAGPRTQRLGARYAAHNLTRGRGFIYGGEERLEAMRDLIQGGSRVVLDLGCRDGALASALGLPAENVVGADIDYEALLAARDRCALRPCLADLWGPLPFRSDSFDLVLAGEIIEHVPFPEDLVEEMARVLNTGGRVVGSVPNAFRLKNRLSFLAGRWFDVDPTHLRHFSPGSLRGLLEQHLTVVEIRPCVGRWVFAFPHATANDLVWSARKSFDPRPGST